MPDGGTPADCWLERWRSSAIAQGTRAMALLRDGVQRAVEHLGTGFLRAPANTALRDGLADGSLALADLHQGLLRLAYRLLFLFVAEDRDALLDPDAAPVAKARYRDYYSTARLRRLALKRRGTAHADLWRAQRLVIARLGEEAGCPELGVPGIGGLFDDQGAEVFADADLPNEALLAAVRDLAVVRPSGQPQRLVDYKNLGAEELGSIYESLLELVPRHDPVHQTFALVNLAGNDRKTTGSYYTPSALIDLVLDETLDPLLDEAERAADPEAVLLAMTVCDPACGSGHFLVAAARRIAERLAVVRSGESDPTPTHVRAALHDVVDRCIYGVDLNPLAAELAKVSLWLEAMQAGRPLSFLDAHVKVGNALLGTTPELIAAGIPDDAFVALGDDDKPTTTTWKRRNKVERDARAAAQDELDLFGDAPAPAVPTAPSTAAQPGARLADVHALARRYAAWQHSPELARERLLADAWCAAFVQHKRPGDPAVTTGTLDAVRDGTVPPATAAAVHGHAVAHRFFHWHLEFPEVAAAGGFTAMVGNPPWERIKLQEQEFFAQRDPDVATAANAAARKRKIHALTESDPALAAEWAGASRAAEATSHYLRKSGRYPLCGVGDVNTYAVFAELFRSSIAHDGRMGIITPTGLATDATTSAFFADTVATTRLAAFYDFENEAKIFPGVHNQFRFAATTITGGRPASEVRLAFYTRYVRDTAARRFQLNSDEVLLLNPNTGTLPIFRTRRDAEITLGIYRRHSVLVNDATGANPWGLRFVRMLDMANDSGLFRTADQLETDGAVSDGWAYVRGAHRWLPLYEAKMLSHYDHRYATYRDATEAQLNKGTLPRLTDAQHGEPSTEPLARYWVAEPEVERSVADRWDRGWFLGWRDVARSSDARTMVPAVGPRTAMAGGFPLWFLEEPGNGAGLQCAMSSFVFDYVTRQKNSGTHLNLSVSKQLAAPTPASFDMPLLGVSGVGLGDWVRPRVLELTYTSHRIAPYAVDVLGLQPGADPGQPFRWLPERREQLRVELDAAMFHLYGLARDEVEHVMDSFFVVRKYEERDHGEFRTKRLILATYDAMSAAASTGTTYVTPLDPPPGEGPRHPASRDVLAP
ncbi:MAG: N-6 DNA methylase [Cellulomonas sp.]|uniref:Eco57I restriction-modification methylase domain-containing protein n=1 Tax=Cellulomonas sp. TaxID=40001 RepID=UPI002590E8EE|nr:N-6 DNA methylase [Cellulomonas sp.]MCR6704484.1 N-6 DNA methylase [Cellulomonas sp.]